MHFGWELCPTYNQQVIDKAIFASNDWNLLACESPSLKNKATITASRDNFSNRVVDDQYQQHDQSLLLCYTAPAL